MGANATLTGSRWTGNNDITRCVRKFSWSQFVAVRVSENQLSAEGWALRAPGWAAQQNEKEVLLKTEELGVNMLQSLFRLQSPLTHKPFVTFSRPFRTWEVYFSVDFASACICITPMQQMIHWKLCERLRFDHATK